MPKIFISYGRDESHGQNLATETQQQLQSVGFEVFRDVIGLKPGDVWYSKLEFELDSSDLVILIVSEKIRTSEWVHNEISMAKEIGLPIIPVIAETVRMPLWLRHLQTLDFSHQTEWYQLLDAISNHISMPLQYADDGIPVATEIVAKLSSHNSNNSHAPDSSVDDDIPLATELVTRVPRNTNFDYDDLRPVTLPPSSRKVDDEDLNPVALPTASKRKLRTNRLSNSYLSWASETGKDQYGQYADLEINNVTQRFRLIRPGTFHMGSPESEKEQYGNETLHQVTLSEPFWLADTACTQALWLAVMGNNPSHFSDNKRNPVENVSWNNIQEFIQTLGQMKPGANFQLPTEAQWEYACRVGTTTPFSFGENMTSKQVNYNGEYPYNKGLFQRKDLKRGKTLAVQSLPANRWGLYEMHGNVWEWCQDAYQDGLGGRACTDPFNQSGENRVLRGGSWVDSGRDCRSACRSGSDPADHRNDSVGFRLALVN